MESSGVEPTDKRTEKDADNDAEVLDKDSSNPQSPSKERNQAELCADEEANNAVAHSAQVRPQQANVGVMTEQPNCVDRGTQSDQQDNIQKIADFVEDVNRILTLVEFLREPERIGNIAIQNRVRIANQRMGRVQPARGKVWYFTVGLVVGIILSFMLPYLQGNARMLRVTLNPNFENATSPGWPHIFNKEIHIENEDEQCLKGAYVTYEDGIQVITVNPSTIKAKQEKEVTSPAEIMFNNIMHLIKLIYVEAGEAQIPANSEHLFPQQGQLHLYFRIRDMVTKNFYSPSLPSSAEATHELIKRYILERNLPSNIQLSSFTKSDVDDIIKVGRNLRIGGKYVQSATIFYLASKIHSFQSGEEAVIEMNDCIAEIVEALTSMPFAGPFMCRLAMGTVVPMLHDILADAELVQNADSEMQMAYKVVNLQGIANAYIVCKENQMALDLLKTLSTLAIEHERALDKYFGREISVMKLYPSVIESMGKVYFAMGQFRDAVKQCRQALRMYEKLAVTKGMKVTSDMSRVQGNLELAKKKLKGIYVKSTEFKNQPHGEGYFT